MPDLLTTWLSPSTMRLVDLALEEDLGRGDVTSAAVIGPTAQAVGEIVTREPAVIAGIEVAVAVFRRMDAGLKIDPLVQDGDAVAAGRTILKVTGPAIALLGAERTALNFLQRLSGIATKTAAFVATTTGTQARIVDTRKTYPGARALEKQAVRAGGGANHRHDLGSGILIKDNHVAIAGGVTEAVLRARQHAPHGLRIEVEVDTLAQFDEALDSQAEVILLDNFSLDDVREALRRRSQAPRKPVIEVSGGVTLDRARDLAAAGVDIISVGALTHSARAIDLSLDLHLL